MVCVPTALVTGSVARSASRRYLVDSEADFEVFRLAGATRCTDGGEIWHGAGDHFDQLLFLTTESLLLG